MRETDVNWQLNSERNGQVENLERALTRRHVELNSAIEEGSEGRRGRPAARELLARQEEAMNARQTH